MKLAEGICWLLNRLFERFDRIVPIYGGIPSCTKRGHEGVFTFEFSSAARDLSFFNPFIRLRGKKVLDVGCGFGGKSTFYAMKGADVTGVDISEDHIYYAHILSEREFRNPIALRFLVGDVTQLPFDGNTFDIVVSSDLMEHVSAPLVMLNESLRVLKDGGFLFINFGPPWLSPGGGHVGRCFPWSHLLFSENTVRNVWIRQGKISKQSRDKELYSSVNKMTIWHFEKLIHNVLANKEGEILKFQLWTRWFLRPLLVVPGVREFFCPRVIVVLRKRQQIR